ncbi:MAG TPA: Isoquinoline 1-oxidoreductase subunit [Rhodoblastus sp.]|nr:Isoquinoline 1-oxidoreductase subunit [Rhodoblastus sp.]
MRLLHVVAASALLVAGAARAENLRAPADFANIQDKAARSQQMFIEAGKVIQHPRCVNCHPAGDRPTQGGDMHPHEPPVIRGAADFGAPGMECTTCHGAKNTPIATEAIRSVPGNPAWKLAPLNMAWQGRPLAEICQQIKDPQRNGGRDLEKLYHHMAQDDLVGWGWDPGAGRAPAPGTQKEFGALIRAWIDTGAVCPG